MTRINMVDTPQGPDPKRLLLAVVASSAVLLVYSYFFTPTPALPPVAVQEESKTSVTSGPKPTAMNEVADAHASATDPNISLSITPFLIHEPKGQEKRTSYRAEVTNIGASIYLYSLTSFSKEEIIFDEKTRGSSLLLLSLKHPQFPLSENEPYEIVKQDTSSIELRHVTKQGLEIKRHYQFLPEATIREQIIFNNLSTQPLKLEPVLRATKRDKDIEEPGLLNPGVSGQSIALKTDDKYKRLSYSDVKDQEKKSFTDVKYAAFDDQFFLSAIVPDYRDAIDHAEISTHDDDKTTKTANIAFFLKPFVLVPGEEKSLSHQFFIGPKQIDLLSSFSVPLDENIDFGWFGVLSRPMLWLLVQIFGFVKNYGLAIIIITFVIKLLTYPLTQKSFTSQQEMKKLQPKIKDLQNKFGHDRTLLGQKQMELYKSHGVNPLAGCLPLLIQLPIWFAFFQMLRNSVELFDQPFYWWITDLTRPDQYFVLPVLMGVSMLVQQAFTPPPTDQPHMKYVMWSMPIFLTFIMLNMPSGLSLYILTNNLLTIFQQIIIKRNTEKINA